MSASSFEEAIRQSLSPMNIVPTEIGDIVVATTSAVLFDDHPINLIEGASLERAKRFIFVHNLSSNTGITVGLFFLAAGADATGLNIVDSLRLEPGNAFGTQLAAGIRVAAVASSSATVNVLVYDS